MRRPFSYVRRHRNRPSHGQLQDTFDLSGAAQCGFCTPGILCSAAALLKHSLEPTREKIKEVLAGNLCRCTGYSKIYDAVHAAATIRDSTGLTSAGAPHSSGVEGAVE